MPQSPNKKFQGYASQRGRTSAWLLAVLLFLLALFAYAAAQRQAIYDWLALRGYNPPPTISQLASQDVMTAAARKIFYVNHPLVSQKQNFSNYCPVSKREQTIVLGCYHAGQNGIFLLNVSDNRLNGVMQVTAAHEMLHAAYDRLSSRERQKVDGLLTDYYNHGLADIRIKKTLDAYRQTEPHDVVNEMHSIFGTEVANLPPALEQYFSRYFSNRLQIAQYANQYQSVFTSRQAMVAQDDAELAALKAQIQGLESTLSSEQSQTTNQRSALLAKRDSGDIAGYNAGVQAYNNLVASYNSGVHQLQSLVNQYNQLVTTRNAIALEEDQLVSELSANVAPINQ